MPHALSVLGISGQCGVEKPLLEEKPRQQQRHWHDSKQSGDVRSQPEARSKKHEWVTRVKGMGNDPVYARIDNGMLAFGLESHDRDRERIRPKCEPFE